MTLQTRGSKIRKMSYVSISSKVTSGKQFIIRLIPEKMLYHKIKQVE